MKRNEFYYDSADGKTKIHGVEWVPDGDIRAVLQICHGVTEHILRYEEMAEFFTARGFVVAGNDHLGHGTSIAEGSEPMYFGPEGSWGWVEEDAYSCQKILKEKYQNIPFFIVGLSLGSFIVRTYLIEHPGEVSGAILAGTGQTSPIALSIAKFMAKKEGKKAGEEHTTDMIKKLTFETYNKKFSPNRTELDWLCASEKGLDDYMADPLRGKAMSAGLFREMLNGMMFTGKLSNQRKMDKDMPILIVSGEDDPVGDSGNGVRRTVNSFKRAGIKNVKMRLYKGMRHDIFIEDGRKEIFQYMYKWIVRYL